MCVMEREREFVLVVSVSVLVVASAPSSAAKTLEGKKNKFFDLFRNQYAYESYIENHCFCVDLT